MSIATRARRKCFLIWPCRYRAANLPSLSFRHQSHLLLAKAFILTTWTAASPWLIGYRLEFNLKMFMTRAYHGGGPLYDEGWLRVYNGNPGLLPECKWVILVILFCGSLAYLSIIFNSGKVTHSMARHLFCLHLFSRHTYILHDPPSNHVFLRTSWNGSRVR